MQEETDVLIVSTRMDTRKKLVRALEGLPVSTFCVSTIAQALEVLSSHPFAIVFCDELISDGSYRELLAAVRGASGTSRFILMLGTGEWKEYLEALRLGITEVLRSPLQTPDIDIALIHALRQGRENQAA